MKKTPFLAVLLFLAALSNSSNLPLYAANTPDGSKLAGGMTNSSALTAISKIFGMVGSGRPMGATMLKFGGSMPTAQVCTHPRHPAVPPSRNPAPVNHGYPFPVSPEQHSTPVPPQPDDGHVGAPSDNSLTGILNNLQGLAPSLPSTASQTAGSSRAGSQSAQTSSEQSDTNIGNGTEAIKAKKGSDWAPLNSH